MISPTLSTRGNPRQLTDEEKIALLLLDDDDITSAERTFERHVAPAYRGIITGDGWTWDPDTQQYVRRNGKPLSDADLKNIMLLFVLAEENELEDAAESVARGDVTIEQWEDRVTQIIRVTYTASAMVAAGGADQIGPSDISAVTGVFGTETTPGTGLADAITRLQRFAEQIQGGVAGDAAAIIRRGGLYAAPANGVYEAVRRNSQGRRTDENGAALQLEERNILEPGAEHCSPGQFTDGCLQLAEQGWMEFRSMSLPGERTCGPRCKCRMEYRVKPSGEGPELVLGNPYHDSNGRFTFAPDTGVGGGGGREKAEYDGPDRTDEIRARSTGEATVLSGDELGGGSNIQETRDRAESYAKQWLQKRTWTNSATGMEIGISRRGIGKIIANTGDIIRAKLVPAIPSMIERGIPIGPEESSVGSHYAAYRRFAARTEIGGKPRTVKFIVGRNHNGSWYYNHERL